MGKIKRYYDKWLDYVDDLERERYLRAYDDYSLIPRYCDANGAIKVDIALLQDEIIPIMERYLQGFKPCGYGWAKNGGYYLHYDYVNIIDDRSPRLVSRYITNNLIAFYAREYAIPGGYDSYILCDAITHAREHVISVYLKGTNLSGEDILKIKSELAI